MTPRADLADVVFFSKYARFLPEKARRETYDEAVSRVMGMHRSVFADAPDVVQQDLGYAEEFLRRKMVLGSQRVMQYAGAGVLKNNARGYNCAFSFCDRERFFAEAFWLLLSGCGVGFSVQEHHVAKLNPVMRPSGTDVRVVVRDSIEGWADAADALIRSYLVTGAAVSFDFSEIRPAGAPISTASGKAPGPKPLRDALFAARDVLDRAVGRALRPIEAYDVMMHLAMAVRSGGVRRSATIALFSPSDEEMMNAKTGAWYETNPQRQGSNNSALLVRNRTSRKEFDRLLQATQEFGEPGFFWTDSTEIGTNPCAEISFHPVTDDGVSGWGLCNLSTVNVAACEDDVDFLAACDAAAVLGTLQAQYTNLHYLTPASREILVRDSLLGVSLTGMADNPDLAFDEGLLRAGVDAVRLRNLTMTNALRVPSAARLTTVKPEGTGSLVLGVGNGIHPHHATRYIRNVQAGANEPHARMMAELIPEAVEPSVWRPGEVILSFPIDLSDRENLWTKANTDAISHLEKVRSVYRNWVQPGTVRGGFSHNVSNTIQVKPGEWAEVGDYIYRNREQLGGVSLLSSAGDLDYPQAPFVAVDGDGDRSAVREKFERLTHAWRRIDTTAIREDSDNTEIDAAVACAGGACSF
jgi:ribonucleoside-triphosphate reductase